MRVLSMSKKAAAVRSGSAGGCGRAHPRFRRQRAATPVPAGHRSPVQASPAAHMQDSGRGGQPADLVSAAAESRPRHAAVVTDQRVVTWSEVDWQVRAVASGLIARGLPAGSRIALMQPNTLEFITTYFGILRAGMCAVPLNTGYTAIELDQMLSDVDASLVVADPRMAPVLDQVPGIDVIHTGTEDWRRFTVGSSPLPVEPTAPDALAVLLFTSGTSGRPKAAMLTHRALSANLDQLSAVQDPPAMTSDDVVMCVLPCSTSTRSMPRWAWWPDTAPPSC